MHSNLNVMNYISKEIIASNLMTLQRCMAFVHMAMRMAKWLTLGLNLSW